jgi:hypothetical protein
VAPMLLMSKQQSRKRGTDGALLEVYPEGVKLAFLAKSHGPCGSDMARPCSRVWGMGERLTRLCACVRLFRFSRLRDSSVLSYHAFFPRV